MQHWSRGRCVMAPRSLALIYLVTLFGSCIQRTIQVGLYSSSYDDQHQKTHLHRHPTPVPPSPLLSLFSLFPSFSLALSLFSLPLSLSFPLSLSHSLFLSSSLSLLSLSLSFPLSLSHSPFLSSSLSLLPLSPLSELKVLDVCTADAMRGKIAPICLYTLSLHYEGTQCAAHDLGNSNL